jgi:ComF family protein
MRWGSLFHGQSCVVCESFIDQHAWCQECGSWLKPQVPFLSQVIRGERSFECYSLLQLQPAIRRLLVALKYQNELGLVSEWWTSHHEILKEAAWPLADLIVPVPLHPAKLRERGYNQAEILANEISKLTGIPVVNDLVIRSRQNERQASLRRDQRQANSVQLFDCRKSSEHLGKSVLMIDDVLTTGATLQSLKSSLEIQGVSVAAGLTWVSSIAPGGAADWAMEVLWNGLLPNEKSR